MIFSGGIRAFEQHIQHLDGGDVGQLILILPTDDVLRLCRPHRSGAR